MGFLVYLILMPIVYCAILSYGHYEVLDEWLYCDEEKKVNISFIILTILKLIIYYGIEIFYCLMIKSASGFLPWQEHNFESISSINGYFIGFSIFFIITHTILGYVFVFSEIDEIPPVIHMLVLIVCFFIFIGCFFGAIEDEIFDKLPYKETTETRDLLTLGDSFTLEGDITSRYRYLNIKLKDGYTISYSYLKDEKLYFDSFLYSEESVIIEESLNEKTYIEITKHYKELKTDSIDRYDEYFTYHVYLPKGTLTESNINLDLN